MTKHPQKARGTGESERTPTYAVPRDLAGPGPSTPIVETLWRAGWSTQRVRGMVQMTSPDRRANVTALPFDEQVGTLGPAWEVEVRPAPDAAPSWVATFSAHVPSELVAAFLDAVTDATGLPRRPGQIPVSNRAHVQLIPERPHPPARDTSAEPMPLESLPVHELRAALSSAVIARHPKALWIVVDPSCWIEDPEASDVDLVAVLASDSTVLYAPEEAGVEPGYEPWAAAAVRLLTHLAVQADGDFATVLRGQDRNGQIVLPLTPWAEQHLSDALYEAP